MRTYAAELRHAWRSLRRRPAFAVTSAATLTLVIGANAALFAVVNTTLLRPLPFAAGSRVVHLFSQPPGTSSVLQRNPLQQMEVPRLRERSRTLARIEGFFLFERVVTLAGEPSVARGATVTPGLFAMMDAPLALGRVFTPAEGEPGQPVAVITDRYWRGALGSRDVLGTSLVIDDQPHTIVGVLSAAYRVPFLDADVFTPLVISPEPVRAPPRTVVALAELAPGATVAQARDELAAISGQLAQEFPRTHAHWTLRAQPVRDWQYGPMRAPLLMLLGATVVVLIIACVNLANVTTAHAVARAGEMSLRLALGASRADMVRMHFAELLIVCLAGLIPGLLLAHAAVPALLAVHPTIAQSLGEVSIDWRVQAFSALLAVLTAAAASVMPALRSASRQASATLAETAVRTTRSARADRVQRALVSAEVALSVALLMAGAVIVQGLRDLSARGPGYQTAGVLTAQVRLPEASYRTPASRSTVVNRLIDEIRGLPGVASVAITQNAFIPAFSYQTLVTVRDRPTPDDQPHTVQFRRVSPDYFRAMQIRTTAGRAFDDEDTAERPPVAIVSRRFAELLLPGLDPLGRQLFRTSPPDLTIIGVVDDVSDVTVTAEPEPTLYLPWAQNNNFGVPVALIIRTSVEPSSLIPAVRQTVKGIDPALPLRKAQPLEVFVAESTAPERFRMFVLNIMALLGLVLAAVGIAGMTYRGVTDRTREFAIRLALGSAPGGVLRLVLRDSLRDLAIGVAAGVAGGTAICTLLARTLEHVAPMDPGTTGVSVVIILLAGVTAVLLPAGRVMRVRPAAELRF